MSELKDMQAKLRQFNRERDWDQFHCPRNLAMCLNVEAAELLECFLWIKDGEPVPENKHIQITEEAADVLICLLNFCEQANVDLSEAFYAKLAKNAAKYPVEKARGSRHKYNEL